MPSPLLGQADYAGFILPLSANMGVFLGISC